MKDIFRELLFLGKCHHSFLDKPYQELDFTRHLNSVLGRNTVRSADVSHDFISFICFCSRLCWSWKVPISILWLMKICVRFQYVPWKNVWLCFISIASVHFSHKIEKFHLELKHNNNKKDMVSHLNMCHGKMYDFVSFLKLTNFILKVIEILQIFFIRKDIRGIGWKTEGGGVEVWMKRDFEEKSFVISGIAIYYCHFFDYILLNVLKTWLM